MYVVYIYKYGEYLNCFVFVYDVNTPWRLFVSRSGRDVFGHLCIFRFKQ